ncbi:Hypothetical protein, putative [Bodo saltans]|uniref:RPGR-interacting protein 1 first C2 domain-containing protein n=1 Tax=Bodo saltans TaxID=75058 RepID=A0A0S4IU72_BODSA|nr:Hypothetical protein, putative [Bodo saltans]|eukprot:CUG09016.1 Hypothetical protein, putative [Bodo saltans]
MTCDVVTKDKTTEIPRYVCCSPHASQRLVDENHQLKVQRNELQDKLKDLTTKYRKLIRDLKLGTDVEVLMLGGGAAPTHSSGGGGGKVISSHEYQATTTTTVQHVSPQRLTDVSGSAINQHNTSSGGIVMQNLIKERDALCDQVVQLQRQAVIASATGNMSSPLSSGGVVGTASPTSLDERIKLQQLEAASQYDKQRMDQLQQELQRLQSMLQQEMNQRMLLQQQVGGGIGAASANSAVAAVKSAAALHDEEQLRHVRIQLQQQQHEAQQLRSNVEHLSRERDTLQMQLRLSNEIQGQDNTTLQQGFVDPMSLFELQHDLQSKVAQITVLSNRLTYAQSQLGTFKQECERLVNELRLQHNLMSEVKKQLFDQEHEKASLTLKCERLGEVEMSLHHKQEELLRTEQQLLRMVEKLQTVSRETEMAVRRELAQRLAEVEQSRDEAEKHRRSKEKALYESDHELSELRRKTELLNEALAAAKKDLQKESEEKKELATRNALLSGVSGDLGEDVHKAVALATMRQRLDRQIPHFGSDGGARGGANNNKAEANSIVNMWDEGLEWNEGWEASKLRESMATAALDLELADTRIQQLSNHLNDCERMLSGVSEERDTLLDENSMLRRRISASKLRESMATAALDLELADTRIQQLSNHLNDCERMLSGVSEERDTLLDENSMLRRRISGVQTSLAKRQLARYRQQMASTPNCGILTIRLRSIRSALVGDDALQQAVAGTFFMTLDHVLPSYETLVSNLFYSLNEANLTIEFRFPDVHLNEATLASLRNATFDLQLHRCGQGNSSEIIGYAEWPSSKLLESDSGCAYDASIQLVHPSSGEIVATCAMDVESENLVLPVLLGAPLSSIVLDPSRTTNILYDLRAVVGLRVQVFSLSKLPLSVASPYVFYTCSMVDGGAAPIVDTTIEPLAGARVALQQYRARVLQQQQQTSDPQQLVTTTAAASHLPSLSFEHDARDHSIVLDRRNIHSIAEGVLVFCVFDRSASDVESHVGILQVPLRPLLEGPQTSIFKKEAMSPAGEVEIGVSWILAAAAA